MIKKIMLFDDKSLLLTVDSLKPGNGGIARVARLMVKALLEQFELHKFNLNVLAYQDNVDEMNLFSNFVSAKGSKIRFMRLLLAAAMRNRWFAYDFLGLCRGNIILKLLNRPFLTWMHGIEVWEQARPVYAAWAKRATLLLVNTQYTLSRAEKIHGTFHNARVCWLGTESDDPSKLDFPQPHNLTVSIIGRIDKKTYKGHFPLIECWPNVVDRVPGARLKIVGDGPGREEVLRAIEKSSAAEYIDNTGFVPDNQMDAIWKQTKLLAMPSQGEGFGVVYIEAMRHGRPVIASVHDAAQEINLDGHTGFNVDLNIPGQLADRIVYLLTHQNKVIEMGNNGRHRWKQHFCFSAFSGRFRSIMREFIR